MGMYRLEGNVEYRFPVSKIAGVKSMAQFLQISGMYGYLKMLREHRNRYSLLNGLTKDIAVGAGAGIRIDFSFFVIRLDYSYKVKDPSPNLANAEIQNKWFGYRFSQKEAKQFQLGISYPFIF